MVFISTFDGCRYFVTLNTWRKQAFMKVVVIGSGNVGLAVFRELQRQNEINELVLAGRNKKKILGEIMDLRDADVLSSGSTFTRLVGGGYEETKNADIIIYAAGVGRKPGQDRLSLVQENAVIAKNIFTEVLKYNQKAIILVISNPVDVLTAVIREITGFDRSRVIGTGTLLDSARLSGIISSFMEISPRSISGLMVGEHGNSSCVLWDTVRIGGISLQDYFAADIGMASDTRTDRLSDFVRAIGGKIIEAKGYTAYGVAAAAASIVTAITQDSHNLYPVSVQMNGEYGLERIALSVPCILGRQGIVNTVPMNLNEEDKAALLKSADTIRQVTLPVLEELLQ